MQTIRIALKNLARQKKRTILLGGAIAFGFLVIILLGSFTSGVLDAARDNLAGILGGHLYVRGEELSASNKLIAKIGDRAKLREAMGSVADEVERIQVRSRGRGEAIFGSRQETLIVEGVDWAAEAKLWDSLSILQGEEGSLAEGNAIVLPSSIAAELGAEIGETILYRLSTVSGQANVGEFKLVATYEEQEGLGGSSAYASLPYLNGLLGLEPDDYQSLNITLRRMEDMDAAASGLSRALSLSGAEVAPKEGGGMAGFRAMFMGGEGSLAAGEKTWAGTRFSISTLNEVMEPLLSLVRTLEYVRFALFAVLLLIIVVGLLNSFRMILIERTEEIGTMRALGMQRGGIRDLFLLEALFLALAGAAAGLIAAEAASAVLAHIRFEGIAALRVFTREGRFSFPTVPADIVTALFFLVAGTLVSAWIPARRAARLDPADALRSTY